MVIKYIEIFEVGTPINIGLDKCRGVRLGGLNRRTENSL